MSFNSKKSLLVYYIPFVLIASILFTYTFLLLGAKKTEAGWYASGGTWLYRKQITIDHTKVSTVNATTLVNFPMLFSVTDPDLKFTGSGGQVGLSTGFDILFTSSDGTTKLNHEIEKYVSTTGETLAWVQIPSLSPTVDTIIYVYYGNAVASNQQNASATWDSNFVAVYHFGNGVTLGLTDSTSNSFGLTNPGTDTFAAGQIGGSTHHNGNNGTGLNNSSVAIGAATDNMISYWDHTSGNSATFNFQSGTCQTYDPLSGTLYYDCSSRLTAGYSNGSWNYIVLTSKGNGTGQQIFVNGSLVASAGSNTSNAVSVLRLGFNNGGFSKTGDTDEFRLSRLVRSADWIKTEYNNQNAPSSFYTYGTQSQDGRSSSTAGVKIRGGQTPAITTPQIKVRGGVKFR